MTVGEAVTGSEALREAVRRFRAAGIDTPERDARRLLAWAINDRPDRLTLLLTEDLSAEARETFEGAVAMRLTRAPVSHITGRRMFWGREFHVGQEVLDPRPETEMLVEIALTAPFTRVLDLGTGSGCILLTLLAERPGAVGTGTDISAPARAMAEGNAMAIGVSDRAEIVAADWFAPVEGQGGVSGTFDLIVSNPPYIAASEMAGLQPEVRDWEPRLALTDEADGLTAYRAIAECVAAHLAPGGRLLVEIGPTQGAAVRSIFGAAGLEDVQVHPDLDSRDRVVSAVRHRP